MIKNETTVMDAEYKSIHYSCRLDAEVYSSLADEAKQKDISMNNLLNHVAREYVRKRSFEKIGMTSVCKDALREVFDMLDDKQLIKLATKLGSSNAVEYVRMLYHDTNKFSVLKFLDLWGSRFSGYEHKNHNFVHRFSIPHEINEKYSLFMKEYITSFLESAINVPVKVQSTSRAVMFSVTD